MIQARLSAQASPNASSSILTIAAQISEGAYATSGSASGERHDALRAEPVQRFAQLQLQQQRQHNSLGQLQASADAVVASAGPPNQLSRSNFSVNNDNKDLKSVVVVAVSEHDQTSEDKNGTLINRSNFQTAATRRNKLLFDNDASRDYKSDDNYKFKSTTAATAPQQNQEVSDDRRRRPQMRALNSTIDWRQRECQDSMPLFVAQNSICWYALSAGLSCYLLDLILRKRRRSKGTIRLLDVRADSEGNLIELIFSNNHRRFTHWLPGQFVYLNCPQVAGFEWHPFTISSMDNANRLFTLHIKTGGDWTRKLRTKLGLSSDTGCCSDSGSNCGSRSDSVSDFSVPTFKAIGQDSKSTDTCSITITSDSLRLETPILPDFIPYNKSGKPLVKCTKLIRISHDSHNDDHDGIDRLDFPNETPRHGVQSVFGDNQERGALFSISADPRLNDHRSDGTSCGSAKSSTINLNVYPLDLYIDGPFHSPFERLLEQPVSIGIANGVGWTAFSSAFQCVTNNLAIESNKFSKDWWKQQHRLYLSSVEGCHSGRHPNKLVSRTRLHLLVIVTSIEQLKPFYKLALNYFERINECIGSGEGDTVNPVREITAFITRSNKDDKTVTDFCAGENLDLNPDDGRMIRVTETFKIQFGRPDFEKFLGSLRAIYADEEKISVYCCGSGQVKKIVRELCRDLNKTVQHESGTASRRRRQQLNPLYSYHEESF